MKKIIIRKRRNKKDGLNEKKMKEKEGKEKDKWFQIGGKYTGNTKELNEIVKSVVT